MDNLITDLAGSLNKRLRSYHKGILYLLNEIFEKDQRGTLAFMWLQGFLKEFETDFERAQVFIGLYSEQALGHPQYRFLALYKTALSAKTFSQVLNEILLTKSTAFYEGFIESILLQSIYSTSNKETLEAEKYWNLEALYLTIKLINEKEVRHYKIEASESRNEGERNYGVIYQNFQKKLAERLDKKDSYEDITSVIEQVPVGDNEELIRFLYGTQLRIASNQLPINTRKNLISFLIDNYPTILVSPEQTFISEGLQLFIKRNLEEKEVMEYCKLVLIRLFEIAMITEDGYHLALELFITEPSAGK